MSTAKQYYIVNSTSNLYYNEMFGWHPTQCQLYDTADEAFDQIEKLNVANCFVGRMCVDYELVVNNLMPKPIS